MCLLERASCTRPASSPIAPAALNGLGRLGWSFWQYLGPGRKQHPETHSNNIWRQAAKMLKTNILSIILAISGSSTQHAKHTPPDTHSGNTWAQAAKMLKMNIRAGKAVRLYTFETPSRGLEEKPRSPTTKSPGGAPK